MISGIDALRTAYRQLPLHPNVKVYLRQLVPSWSQVSYQAAGYIENPDMVNSGGAVKGEYGRAGTLVSSFGGWHAALAADSCYYNKPPSANEYIVRIMCPATFGENDAKIYVFATKDVTVSTGWRDPIRTITPTGNSIQLVRTRGGVVADTNAIYYYYVGNSGFVYQISGDVLGQNWSSPVQVASAIDYSSVASWGITVAPTAVGEYWIFSRTGNHAIKADLYKNNALVSSTIIAQVQDEEPDWTTMLWCDAERLYNGWVLIANTSKYGASYSFLVDSNYQVNDASPVLPFNDLDWTGTLRIASLSNIGGRLWAVAGQRFNQGDGSFSRELWSLVWTTDGEHWAQPSHMAIGSMDGYCKAVAAGTKVVLLGNAYVFAGNRTVDFGGSSQLDVSSYVKELTISRTGDGAGASYTIVLNAQARSFLTQPSAMFADYMSWRDYTHQVAVRLVHPTNSSISSLIGVGWLTAPEHSVAMDGLKPINDLVLSAVGSLSQMLQHIQFTDDLLTRAIEQRADMTNNDVVNRNGSIWEAVDGALYPVFPNDSSECQVGFVTSIKGGFEFKARIKADPQCPAYALVFWSGGPDRSQEAHNTDFWRFQFDLAINGDHQEERLRLIQRIDGVDTVLASQWLGIVNDRRDGETWWDYRVTYRNGTLTLQDRWDLKAYTTLFSSTAYAVPYYETSAGVWYLSRQTKVYSTRQKDETWIDCEASVFDWPVTGSVRIGDEVYNYTRTLARLDLDRGLVNMLNKGTNLVLANAKLGIDWAQFVSRHQRWSVADICRHLVKRAGVNLAVDNLYNLSTDDPYVNDFSASVFVSNFSSGDMIKVSFWVDQAGVGHQVRMYHNGSTSLVGLYDPDNVELDNSPLGFTPGSTGRLRVVVFYKWVHVYWDGQHVTSWFKDDLIGGGLLQFSGTGITINERVLEVGHEMIAGGVWDGQSPGREVLGNILEGLPITISENNDITLRLRHSLYPDYLGAQNVAVNTSIGRGRSPDAISAGMLEGGYSWIADFNTASIRRVGLRWGKMTNHYLTSVNGQARFLAQSLKLQQGSLDTYSFRGLYDPAMQIGDRFTVTDPLGLGYPSTDYIVATMNLVYRTGEQPLFMVEGQAVGYIPAENTGTWDSFVWGEKEWTV